MEYAMELRDLRKEYKEFTLDNISLSLPMGCIMGFIGENGAGKSTTIKAMLGLIRPDGGSIRLLGQDPASSRAVMEQVGVVLDAGFFPPEMNPKQLGKALGRIYKGWQPAAYDDYLRRFEIAPGKKIKAFSRGMVMKLSLAVALSHGAKLLVLDEATSGLDPIIRDDILDILYDFIQDEEHSVFLSSHITGDLEKIADYLAFIHQGKVLMAGEKDTLLETYGLYHCTGEGICSWYDFASEIIRLSGVDASVAPCTSEEYKAKHPESADRPKWSALDNRMLRCTVGNDVRDWKDALACFFAHWDGENGMKG